MTNSLLRALTTLAMTAAFAACAGGGDDAPPTNTPEAPTIATFYAADAGDQAAAIVSGDFNGDGIADVALGAANADGPIEGGSTDAGEVLIFHGPVGPGDVRDFGAVEGDIVLYGPSTGSQFGRTLVTGDFDGDGIDDLVVAAPLASESAGQVEVMFGGRNRFNEGAPTTLTGQGPGDYAGLMMTAADFDGDGRDDLLIGALQADGPDNARQDGGEAYLVSGTQLVRGEYVSLSDTSLISGAEAGDRLGETLAAGDVNGDGKPDIIVAAPFASGPNNERESAGETYVFFSPLALPIDLAETQADITIIGRDAGDQLGHAIAVGDRDGDGAADIALGAVSADGPENAVDLAGEVIFINGTIRGVVDTTVEELPLVYGPEKEARLGRYARGGTFSDSSKADVVVSAPNLATRAGIVYLFRGEDDLPSNAVDASLTLAGFDPGDVLGTEIFGSPPMTAADIDGDGNDELLISAPQADGPDNARTDAGEAYIIFFGATP